MPSSLYDLLPRDEAIDNDTLLGRFLDYVQSRQLRLYPAQETAILELFEEKNVILNTPTGSGKSLVAAALHFKSIAQGRRSVYTCPIKALVNEKWLDLCREFGPDNVGLSTGDASVNREAPILCCTAEILANIALRQGPQATVHDVVMDEFHYYADRERGVAWQIPLLTLPQSRFLLMSATLGDTAFFEEELHRLTRQPVITVQSSDRPVPLELTYVETPLAQTLEQLVAERKSPVYIVHFTQLDAAHSAQDFTSLNVCSRDQKNAIAEAISGFHFNSPYGPDIRRWLKHGIGIHHAGLLPKYRVLVEQLAQKGLLHVICGTDTLGVGINVPIRTVLFTRLCKFDGEKTGILSARDFHQIAGRAGRKGFDDRGWVVVQAPEHTIENLQLEKKAARAGKKFVRRKPPERNFVNWDRNTFLRLIAAPPERLTSRFHISHGMLLNVLSRDSDGCQALRQMIASCHETPKARKAHRRRAWQLFRSLLNRGIIEFIPPTPSGAKLRVNVELQDDFSMDQTLSLYLIETLPLLDPEHPGYPLELITLVESILEDPDLILRKQLDKLKAQRVAEMKREGLDYQERMDELDKLQHPKPNADFVYSTFNAFADRHPWVGQENIHPKSIAREMFESFRSFADYVRDYELERAEGLLLRHLSRTHKVLAQTVPDTAKTDPVRELELYLHTLIRQVDSSLLEEWERLRDPNRLPAQPTVPATDLQPATPVDSLADITRDPTSFTHAIRIRIFTFLRALAIGDYPSALETLSPHPSERTDHRPSTTDDRPLPASSDPSDHGTLTAADLAIPLPEPWTSDRLRELMAGYQVEHDRIRLDPDARNLRHTHVLPAEDRQSWRIQQMLLDPRDLDDWCAEFHVDLPESRAANEPVLRLLRLGPLV